MRGDREQYYHEAQEPREHHPRKVLHALAALGIFYANASLGIAIHGNTLTRNALTQVDTHIVAMGDSFSAAPGKNEDPDTDTSDNQCHRSDDSYAYDIAEETGATSYVNVACSGAKIDNVLHGMYDEGPQIDALSPSTTDVYITIGTNDLASLTRTAAVCQSDGCGRNTGYYQTVAGEMDGPVYTAELTNLYQVILQQAPKAHVYVVGYPNILGDIKGLSLLAQLINKRIGAGSIAMSTLLTEGVDEVNERTITAINSPRLSYIPATNIGLSFHQNADGHPEALLHPTQDGYKKMAAKVIAAQADINKKTKHN